MSRLYLLCPLFFFTTYLSSAQELKGVVKDVYSDDYVSSVTIKVGLRTTYSDSNGRFALSNITFGDTVTFSSIGYHERKQIVYNPHHENWVIYMEPAMLLVDEVNVNAIRNYTADSLKFREDFAKAFNYNKPKFMDIFIPKNYSSNTPKPYYQANNSTASLISVDVLSVISLLRKNRTPQSKLQQELIKEEEQRYLDNNFSKRTIQNLTGLEDDSLQTFMLLYRPNIDTAKGMSEYEIMLYIKNSYREYSNQ